MTLECMKYSDLYRTHVICTSWQTLWDAEMFELVPSKKIGALFLLFFFLYVRTISWRHQHAIRSQGYAHTTDSPWLQLQFVGVHQMT